MRGRIAVGLLSCVYAAVATNAAAAVSAETPSGAVYVTTLPSGADIWVDGTYVGRAPVLVDALAPGHHSLSITKTGWAVAEVDVAVEARTIALSSTRLAAARPFGNGTAGAIVLRAVPAGASLELDDKPFAASPGQSVPLAPGTHRIAVGTSRGRTSRTFIVLPDTTTDIVLRDVPEADAPSAVVAPAEDYLPTDAFTIEGKKIVVHYAGHVVVAHLGDEAVRIDGSSVTFDSAPQSIGGKLYMPLRLLEKLTADTSKSE